MKTILVINSGSTSLKYELFAKDTLKSLQEGNFQNITSHASAFKKMLKELANVENIVAVGHRIVHGGNEFIKPTLVTSKVLKRLKKYNILAPLHNPYNLAGIRESNHYIPHIPDIAVFDTAYFKDLPERAKIYALPIKFYKKYHIQRFGFHGISHQYAAEQTAKKLKKPLKSLKLITCHLGGGSSITAIKNGRPIDTSLGFSTLEGLIMMTRPGDVDAEIILYLQEKLKLTKKKIRYLLYHQSGLKGLAECSDYLKLLAKIKKGNKAARLAWDIYLYRIQKYIGAYFAVLGGIDALVFTGAIGAGKPITRQKICQGLKFLNKVKVFAIPTDEELMIAREVKRFL